jgi:hypothetical protein
MRWVPVAAQRPHRCAAIPLVGAHHAKGFIDTGYDLHGWDPHVYISVVAVEEMARMIGWVRPGDVAGREAEVDGLKVRVAELEADIEAQARVVEAAHTLRLAHEAVA